MQMQTNNSKKNLKNPSDLSNMDYDEALDYIKMKKRIQQAKAMHPYPINHTEKSGYFTVVDDLTKGGKKKIRRCSEESLWEALADWYIDKQHDANMSLMDVYAEWIQWKTTPKNADNIQRIAYEWNAYYLNEPLSKELIYKPLVKVTSLELRQWAESLLKKHFPVDKKKFSRMFSIINQCLEFASDEDVAIIPENLWTRARKKINKDLIVSMPTASDDTQVFTDEERRALKSMVYEDLERYQNKPTSAGLQILFLFETGLRIGECCGLKWSDIKGNRLYIRRQATNEGVKEWLKTGSSCRDIPLTSEAQRILEDVKKFNDEHGFTAEWIFQSDNPEYDNRLSYNAADRKLRKLCKRLETPTKSPHKLRKTCLSILLDNPNINNRTVQRFAGHSTLATTYNYYNFDRTSKEVQALEIDRALAL